MEVRKCRDCLQDLPLNSFGKLNKKQDGTFYYRKYCKLCGKQHTTWTKEQFYEASLKSRLKRTLENPSWWKEYRDRNLDEVKARSNLYKRRVRFATPNWADKTKIKEIYKQASRLNLTVDHIIPLNHPLVCGLNVPENLQILSRSANSSKNNTFQVE